MKLGQPWSVLWALLVVGGGVGFLLESLGQEPAVAAFRRGMGQAQAERWEEAEKEFRLAAGAVEPELLSRARHNLGWTLLRQALDGQGESALRKAREAVVHLETALRLRPGDHGVAWNLELALRRVEELEGSGEVAEQARAHAFLAALGAGEGSGIARGGLGERKRGVGGSFLPGGAGPWW